MALKKKKAPKKSKKNVTTKKNRTIKKVTKKSASVPGNIPTSKTSPSRPIAQKANATPPTLVQTDPTALEIIRRIRNTFAPTYMTLQDLTAKHKSHNAKGNHYEIRIVSDLFNGLSRIQRSQWVNTVFSDLYGKIIHALKLDLKTPEETPLPEFQPKPLARQLQSNAKDSDNKK
jgi:stress-induced morphogen